MPRTKRPFVAALLTAVYVGLGHLYVGRWWLALVLIVLYTFSLLLIPQGPGLATTPLLLAFGIFHAVRSARRRNDAARAEGRAFKKCPRCAELVKSEAQICRFCRHEFDASRSAGALCDVMVGPPSPVQREGLAAILRRMRPTLTQEEFAQVIAQPEIIVAAEMTVERANALIADLAEEGILGRRRYPETLTGGI